jgi:NADP-dependent 3-hydroxy acid dehydrogenase YdfG
LTVNDSYSKVSSPTSGRWNRLLSRVLRRMSWRAQSLRNSSLRSDSSTTVAPDIAEAIAFSVAAPPNVNVAEMVVVPVRQG